MHFLVFFMMLHSEGKKVHILKLDKRYQKPVVYVFKKQLHSLWHTVQFSWLHILLE